MEPFRRRATSQAGSGPHGIAVGDFNRDGTQDLAVANLGAYPQRATTVAVLLGQGDGTFRAPQTFEAGHALTGVAIGDFNRDGLQDLTLSSGDDATVSVLLGNGNGTFQPVRSFGAGSSPKSVAVGDFNADQMPDLVVTDHFSDAVSVLLGNGDGTFLGRQWVDTGRNPAWVSVGDLNGDGVQDLAVANWFATTVSVLPGKGDGTFHPGQDFGASAAPEKAILADFNGDGQLDIAVANYFAATVSVLINTTIVHEGRGAHVQPSRRNVRGTRSRSRSARRPAARPSTTRPTAACRRPLRRSTPVRSPSRKPRRSGRSPRRAGWRTALSAAATYTIRLRVATPSFTPAGGTYVGSATVTISDATSGATIHYTTDGSTPTASSPVYSGPILVTQTTTIRAMATASGMTDSDVASATYTIASQVATPSFTPPAGTYSQSQMVTLSVATSGATIHYTTDGTTPTASSPVYGGADLRHAQHDDPRDRDGERDDRQRGGQRHLHVAGGRAGLQSARRKLPAAAARPALERDPERDDLLHHRREHAHDLVDPLHRSDPGSQDHHDQGDRDAPGWSQSPVASATYSMILP